MTISEVAGLLGYSREKVEKLITEGVKLPKSGEIAKLAATSHETQVDISDDQFNEFVARFEEEEPSRWPPAAIRRELLIEAKHRCAICKDAAPIQFHHMLEWASIKHHDAQHMLAVCGTCHSRCTNGFIDYKAQAAYKGQLKQTATSGTQKASSLGGPHSVTPAYRRIEDTELRSWLTIGEKVALRALADEFGCEVRTNVKVTAGEGWFNLNAAVVRGEDLVAIEIYENKGGGIPYFQIEHLIQVASQVKFERFQRIVLYVVVVSAVDHQLDEIVRAELAKLTGSAPCDVQVRTYRLNPLRAQYSM